MKFLSAFFGLLVFLAALLFALSNKQSVTVSLDPFDLEMTGPLYVFTLGALGYGLLLGGFFIWLGHLPHRFKARKLSKTMVILSDKLLETERELEQYRARERASNPQDTAPQGKWRFWERLR